MSTSLQKKSDFDFLSLATNRRFWSIFAWIRSYNLCVENMPETDFGMPGMTQIMARPACQRIWHAGHVRKFGMPGMPEILLGMNTYNKNLGFSRPG